MKTLIRILCAIALAAMMVPPTFAGDVNYNYPGKFNVKIIPPTQYEDNSPLLDSDIAGYRVYYGKSSGSYTVAKDVGKTTSVIITGIPPGKYFVVATCISSLGKESKYSNEIVRTVEASTPKPPSCE